MAINLDDKAKLKLLIAEATARGLELPDVGLKKEIIWPLVEGFLSRADGKPFSPTADQRRFIESRARFSAYTGGRGSGKTASGAQKALQKIMQGENGAVFNPDFENFRISTWPEFNEWIPWNMVVPSQRYRQDPSWEPHKPFSLVFVNGAKVICKGLKNPDAARGPNINWLWYDEGSRDLDGMSWKMAIASVRVGKEPQAWTTATPRGRDHWIYKFFHQQVIGDDIYAHFQEDRPLVETFHGSIDDNKDNLDPGFYASMMATYPPGWLREQELFGKFVDQGGILGNPAWFSDKRIPSVPESVQIKQIVRYWDLAASEKKLAGKRADDPDETVGTLMAWDGKDFYIIDQVSGYWDYKGIKEMISAVAELDGPLVPIYVEQEPGSGGKNQVGDIASIPALSRFSVRAHRPQGDKVLRANIWFGEAAKGKVWLVDGAWIDGFLSQLSSFPLARHDDRVDSISGARLCVAPVRMWKKTEFLAI